MHGIADLHFDIVSLANNADIGSAQLAQQIKRKLRLLAQRQTQTVFAATLAQGRVLVLGHTIKTVGRTRTIDSLMRTLMVVKPHPVIQPLTSVSKGGEHRFFQKLTPDRLPEPPDLAQRHRMMWG